MPWSLLQTPPLSGVDNMAVDAPSKTLSVNLTEELVRGLDSITDVSYMLN